MYTKSLAPKQMWEEHFAKTCLFILRSTMSQDCTCKYPQQTNYRNWRQGQVSGVGGETTPLKVWTAAMPPIVLSIRHPSPLQ